MYKYTYVVFCIGIGIGNRQLFYKARAGVFIGVKSMCVVLSLAMHRGSSPISL